MASSSTFPKQDSVQRTLRRIAIGAAACGLFLNLISIVYATSSHYRGQQHSMVDVTAAAFLPLILSLAWNHANIQNLPGVPKVAIAITDSGFFLSFTAVAIANGIVMGDFGGWIYAGVGNLMLYTYNSVPWLVCAILHLGIAAMVVVRRFRFRKSRRADATCPDCKRKWRSGKRGSEDGADGSLFAVQECDDGGDGA